MLRYLSTEEEEIMNNLGKLDRLENEGLAVKEQQIAWRNVRRMGKLASNCMGRDT